MVLIGEADPVPLKAHATPQTHSLWAPSPPTFRLHIPGVLTCFLFSSLNCAEKRSINTVAFLLVNIRHTGSVHKASDWWDLENRGQAIYLWWLDQVIPKPPPPPP